MSPVIIFAFGVILGAVIVIVSSEIKHSREARQAQEFFRSQADIIAKAVAAQKKAAEKVGEN